MKRSVLARKRLRDLWRHRGLVASIAAIVVLGTSSFCTMVSVYRNLSEARDGYYRRCRLADFWVLLKRMPRSELTRIRQAIHVRELDGRIAFDITAAVPRADVRPTTPRRSVPVRAAPLSEFRPGDRPSERWQPGNAPVPPFRWVSGRIVSIEPRAVLPPSGRPAGTGAAASAATAVVPVNSLVLRRGWNLRPDGRREVLVDDAFARHNGLEPGDRLQLLLNEQLYDVTVVGTVQSPEFVYVLPPGGLIPDPQRFGVFFARREFLEEAFDFGGSCNQLIGRLAPGQDVASVLRTVEALCRDYGVVDTIPRARWLSNWFLSNELRGLRVTTYFLPTLFFAVAALLLDVLMMRLVRQQRTTIGTLKALGYDDGPIVRHYLGFAAVVGVLGGGLGVAVAW
ncbi:MAG: ABC transporter permease, partial [Planctomycetota bacterium]